MVKARRIIDYMKRRKYTPMRSRALARALGADGDGYQDLLVQGRRLFKNSGPPGWTFQEVTDAVSITGGGGYGTWGGYSMSMSTTEVVQRTEGTVAIDIIDASRQQLVWEGAASGRVTDRVRENRAEAVNVAVRDILARFP